MFSGDKATSVLQWFTVTRREDKKSHSTAVDKVSRRLGTVSLEIRCNQVYCTRHANAQVNSLDTLCKHSGIIKCISVFIRVDIVNFVNADRARETVEKREDISCANLDTL